MVPMDKINVICTKTVSSLPILITCELLPSGSTTVEFGNTMSLEIHRASSDLINFTSVNSICRLLARMFAPSLYGNTILEKTEIDHWLETCSRKYTVNEFKDCIQKLDSSLVMSTYLVGDALTLADVCVSTTLYANKHFQSMFADGSLPSNVKRWYSFLSVAPAFQKFFQMFPIEKTTSSDAVTKEKTEDKGKFVDLPGAEMGKVVVRFPPEASGFLHIGHAKAALLNAHYQTHFNGKLIMRFDDTNPEKEKEDFEKVILEDVALLQIKPDIFTYTSDHFEDIQEKCEYLLKTGVAYVDDTDPETMKNEREQRQESKNRNNSVEKNWKMWEEMKKGTDYGKRCCVRAKIDMKSDNGCLRDPTLYRCKAMPHPRTGDKYKVYPTYDFACPIVDSKEGVTHALRTTEYHDRDDQYFWVIDALKMRKLHIYEYARLNMTNTMLSKRKLTWFVNEGYVDGWDDPRMPTVRGVLRRGMTVEGLKQFIVAQGSSRSVVVMEWDKIWAFNKKVIDPIAPRYNAVEKNNYVPVVVEGATKQQLQVAKHPKNPDLGTKVISVGPRLLVDSFDAEAMKEGENVTFINWGNLLIQKINRKPSGEIDFVSAKLNIDNKDYKKTLKVTWVVDSEDTPLTPCMCVYFNHLISKPVLGKDEDFKAYLNKDTKIVVNMLGDPDVTALKKGDIIQIQRKGFFICDEPYDPSSLRHTSVAGPVVLFSIPDGSKDTTSLPSAVRNAWYKEESQKEKMVSLKGKDFERSPQDEVKSIVQDGPELLSKIKEQGDVVRKLKASGADKAAVGAEVKILMQLKEQFKASTGIDWKPDLKLDSPKDKIANVAPQDSSGCGDAVSIDLQIRSQGDLVRKLKSEKAEKSVIDTEVKKLLKLKEEFKIITKQDWKPDLKMNCVNNDQSATKTVEKNNNIINLDKQIRSQGDIVRKLKGEKADKSVIDTEVKKLLKLKEDFKACSNMDWKPDIKLNVENNPSQSNNSSNSDMSSFDNQIRAQGDIVRKLKSEKADKGAIDAEVKKLLKLKEEFKNNFKIDWKPDLKIKLETDTSSSGKASESNSNTDISDLDRQIREQGNAVRKLKEEKAEKNVIDLNVKTLLKLKSDYKNLSGNEWKPDAKAPSPVKKTSAEKQKKPNPQTKERVSPKKEVKSEVDSGVKKITRLGLEVKKEDNLADWYSQVLTKSEMIEYYDVSGCYVLRPWAYSMWEAIQKFFDGKIKAMGVTNCYFPIFVSQDALEREKDHIADFAPEVAWVTKSGSSDLEKPIAIRPTSETVIYPSFAKWIRSHRDLPLQTNQWCNVVRWEFSNPQPFIRTREFLWQEGHTAFASQKEAETEVLDILELYRQVYEYLLAVPVIKGRKTEKEKFAGADFTTTVECYIAASGRGLQGATSHHLGQNFSKMFEITYEDPETNEKKFVYQNSWGLTTRTIGAMVMVHADNTGLVLPPRVALYQVVIVPCGITASLDSQTKDALLAKCQEFLSTLQNANVRVKGDFRDNYSPGWKFNDWELKGVPIRVEIGPKDLAKGVFVAVRRDTGEKITYPMSSAPNSILTLLDDIHNSMFSKAKKEMDEHIIVSYDFNEFCKKLNQRCIIMAPFCGDKECEGSIKKESAAKTADEVIDPKAPSMGAKSLCMPFNQPAEITPQTKCINPSCKNKPKNFTLFGRSY